MIVKSSDFNCHSLFCTENESAKNAVKPSRGSVSGFTKDHNSVEKVIDSNGYDVGIEELLPRECSNKILNGKPFNDIVIIMSS